MNVAHKPFRRLLLGGFLLSLSMTLVACDPAIYQALGEYHIQAIWTQPVKKATVEKKLETKLEAALDQHLKGKVFEVPGPNIYVKYIKYEDVKLGSKAPQLSVPAVDNFATSTYDYHKIYWQVDWNEGNGAKVKFKLILDSTHWWIAEWAVPDHWVKVSNLDVHGSGYAMVALPKGSSSLPTLVNVFVNSANIDLTATAEGWFWSFDISSMVKNQLKTSLLQNIVGKAITFSLYSDNVTELY